MPRELQSPLAVAEHLLDDGASATASEAPPSSSEGTEGESPEVAAADQNPVADEKSKVRPSLLALAAQSPCPVRKCIGQGGWFWRN